MISVPKWDQAVAKDLKHLENLSQKEELERRIL